MFDCIGKDEVGASPFDAKERFVKNLVGVEPACLMGCHDHGVFSTDVIGRDRPLGLLSEFRNDVEIECGGFDHQDICAFFFVQSRFEKGFAAIGWVHLIGFLVAEDKVCL